MVALQLFDDVEQRPTAAESALMDWVSGEAKRRYSGTCPFEWYDALLGAAAKLANPNWRDLTDFPAPLPAALQEAHRAMFRTIEANTILDKTTEELERMRARMARPHRSNYTEGYEGLVERLWVEEVLREREIIDTLALASV